MCLYYTIYTFIIYSSQREIAFASPSLLSRQHSTSRVDTVVTAIVAAEAEHCCISTNVIVAPANEPRVVRVREARVI